MTNAWNFAGESVPLGSGAGIVTLVQGSTFCICSTTGDICTGGPEGLFVRDTRFLSKFVVTFDGEEAEPLASNTEHPFSATFVSRTRPGDSGGPPLVVFRRHWVGRGMRSDIEVRNDSPAERRVVIEVQLGADLADVFAVKEGRVGRRRSVPARAEGGRLVLGDGTEGRCTSVRLPPDAVVSPTGTAWWTATIEPRGSWSACLELAPILGDEELVPRYRCGHPVDLAEPHARQAAWRGTAPAVESDIDDLTDVVRRSVEDLGALRIFDPEHPDQPVIAAGAPWFMTLFGRDSIITAWMALLLEPDLALSVAATLARLQGTKTDPGTEEQPGRILHEVRFGSTTSLALGAGHIYYGTADATPLFVMLVGELRRWGVPMDRLAPLLPAVDAALGWITSHGDSDGDGYVEYSRATPDGLLNQGWKDSADGISFGNGGIPAPPIALAEVQAYCYAAWIAGAELAEAHGDSAVATDRRARAEGLRTAFNRDFWLPQLGTFAIALDGQKKPCDSVTSNPGHCLWAGIVDDDKAAGVAAALTSSEMFSGWGIRTLSTSMPRYNPVSYHNGSVWPHDSSICAAGLRRYGFTEEANRVTSALLAAARTTSDRLPELFSGLSLDEFPRPVAYPTSCSPQAWASGAPLLLLRGMLGLEPDVPAGVVRVRPSLPPGARHLVARGIWIGGARVDITVDGADVEITGLPAGVSMAHDPSPR